MSHLVDIFLQPGKVFADLKEKPTFILPIALLTVLTVVTTWFYFANVDSDWFINRILTANPEATAKEIEQTRKVMPSAQVMGYFATGWAVISVALICVLAALYYFIAGKVAGQPASFRHGLSLAAWSSMPSLLGAVVTLVGVFTMAPQTALESLALLNFDPLFVELPMDHSWSGFAKSFSLLMPWMIFLSAFGWKTWFRTGWGQAVLVSALPYAVIYGGMAVFALLK